MFEIFPEILLVDVTYKLTDLRFKVVIESIVNVFKKYNEARSKTHVIMSELSSCFPSV